MNQMNQMNPLRPMNPRAPAFQISGRQVERRHKLVSIIFSQARFRGISKFEAGPYARFHPIGHQFTT